MFLNALEIQGFKSFPDKTKIAFHKGMTAVVGPNGSGKSNISDAMRWVMGEQSTKTLRGGKMEDVIFAGTQSRKAQGFAAVSLTFENRDRTLDVDADEVTITRKYYRSGESEYLVNGATVRLRDLNELFMDTGLGKDGYSMIGQGKIAEIVGAKSKERREIFEEAAGISKYRYRKAEAERRLAGAQENLLRLYDILAELENRVEPLRIQSEKAAEFIKISDEKKKLEVSLWLKSLEKYREQLKSQENKFLIAKGDEERIVVEVERIEEKIKDTYDKMNECLAKSDEYRRIRDNLQNRIAELKSEVAVKQNDIVHNTENLKQAREELRRLEQNEGEMSEEAVRKREEIKTLSEKLQALLLTQATQSEELATLTREGEAQDSAARALTQRANQLALDFSRCNMTLLTLENTLSEEQNRLFTSENESGTLEAQLQSEAETMAGIDDLLKEIAEKKQSLQNTAKGYELKLQSGTKKYEDLQREHQVLDLQQKEKLQKAKLLMDLEQNLEGFAYSVKAVMKNADRGTLRGIHGTVAQLIQVKEEYAVAVETALGGSLQHIIVDDEAAAKAAIRRLVEDKAGRATFLPLTSVRGSMLTESGLSSYAGFVALGSELVTAPAQYNGIVKSLLGRIAIVDDLDTATVIAKKYGYKFRIVTLDGQQVNVGGSFTGGSATKNQGILSRKNEAERLQAEAAALRVQKDALASRARELLTENQSLKAHLDGTQSELIVANEDAIRFAGDRKRYEQSREQLTGRLSQIQRLTEESRKKIKSTKDTIKETKEELVQLNEENGMLREQSASSQGNQEELNRKREDLMNQLSEASRQEITWQKDLELLKRDLEDVQARKESSKETRDLLKKRIETLESGERELTLGVSRLQEDGEKFLGQIAGYEEQIQGVLAKRQQYEGESTVLRQQEREESRKKEQAAGELARLDEQKRAAQRDYDGIIGRLWEEYELTRSEAAAVAMEITDIVEAQRDLNILKNRIKNLGSVNLAAIEEFKEVSERYAFLKKEVDDASNARDELIRLITSLTKEMEDIFTDNFRKINEHFGKIFAELFGGGKASLELEDPGDVLNCGIEILVQPPGKIIKNLASLSGGEQSFIAIAIYFAILKVKPSPFCVLDEIEAALDDVNVVKYASYLRMICEKTQFILITHRRGTMEEADVLYGVTMQEQGVSKMLELKVSEIAERLKIET